MPIRGNLGSTMGLIRKRANNKFFELESENQYNFNKMSQPYGWIDIFVIKENYFFGSYFRHISLCLYSNFDQESLLDAEFDYASNEYPHCILLIDPTTQKPINTWKMWWWCHHHVFKVFIVFGVEGSIKSMQCGYSLDVELNFASNELSRSKLSKKIGRYVENMKTKSSSHQSSSKINYYYFIILLF